jgi:tRNA U34 5-carboxymethylaminomethyl modifying enzyme MnmG/GidA
MYSVSRGYQNDGTTFEFKVITEDCESNGKHFRYRTLTENTKYSNRRNKACEWQQAINLLHGTVAKIFQELAITNCVHTACSDKIHASDVMGTVLKSSVTAGKLNLNDSITDENK